MTREELKKLACQIIDEHREEIYEIGRDILKEPELGYKEFKTAEKMKKALSKIGYKYTDGHAITGIIANIEGKKHESKIAVMAELDAVISPNHPYCDKTTGAAHACGHNAMCASLIGVAYALKDKNIIENLDGDISLMVVPAEEMVELEYRKQLIDQGKISFMGGKQEFIKLGLFDDIDMTIMQHTSSDPREELKDKKFICSSTALGFMAKMIQYIGKEAHAASEPHKGINALNAANIGLMAVNAQRETFRDIDYIRVHPIITKGGDIVNTVPADVRIETFVRGLNLDAIKDASEKTDRAFKAGGYAVGAKTIIKDIPGYLPFWTSKELADIAYKNASDIIGEEQVAYYLEGPEASSDIGDVCHLIPSFHGYAHAATGEIHGSQFIITDEDAAYIIPAKVMTCMVIDLLYDNAELAKKVKQNYKPKLTKEQYLKEWGKLEI